MRKREDKCDEGEEEARRGIKGGGRNGKKMRERPWHQPEVIYYTSDTDMRLPLCCFHCVPTTSFFPLYLSPLLLCLFLSVALLPPSPSCFCLFPMCIFDPVVFGFLLFIFISCIPTCYVPSLPLASGRRSPVSSFHRVPFIFTLFRKLKHVVGVFHYFIF